MKLHVAGISGGKDSTALMLWMVHESGYPKDSLRFTWCDTGNEHPLTHAYVAKLSQDVWPVETLHPPLDFYALAKKKGRFPRSQARFCTEDLKMRPTKVYVDRINLRDLKEVMGAFRPFWTAQATRFSSTCRTGTQWNERPLTAQKARLRKDVGLGRPGKPRSRLPASRLARSLGLEARLFFQVLAQSPPRAAPRRLKRKPSAARFPPLYRPEGGASGTRSAGQAPPERSAFTSQATAYMQKQYNVLSPDGFPIAHDWFASEEEAWAFAAVWRRRYEEQGYYAAVGRRIPLEDLPDELCLVEAEVDEDEEQQS